MAVGGDDDTHAGATLAPPTVAGGALADGTELVAGRYRIVRWVGGGGMGRVYEAVDTELDERVALKVLRPGLSDDAIERFRREVKLTRRIQHRNVARMFDIGEHAGEKFLTMELVDGEPLKIGTTMAWPRLRAIAEQICAGLAAAHDAGVVHRDLKPDNVLVERGTDRAVITDFGIARGGDDPSVTQVGAVIGTPRYMAPEQLAGNEVDARADLFSLGVMLFELATGTRPWPGDNVIAIAVAQATSEPAVLDTHATEIPAAFAEIVAACLQLDPARRPASARDIGTAIVAGKAELVKPPTRAMLPRRSKPLIVPSGEPVGRAPETTKADTALAVLPVQSAPADAYLADGLREDITDTLSTTAGLRVRPAGHVGQTGADDPRELGKELGVDHVVVATVRRTPTGLRVAARLISVADGFQIWAHKTDCAEAEILAVSERLAHGIASALSTRATSDNERPTDPRAVELYLRARAEMRRFWGVHIQVAADTLEQALEYAPSSPPILGAFAWASVQAWVMRALPELAERGRRAMDRAMPSGHGEAYLAAASYWINRGEPERGAENLGIALVRAPMSAHAHELAGRVLVEVIGPVAARQHFETARGLDPGREQIISGDIARLEALEGNFASADERVNKLLADPDDSLRQLGSVFQARLAAWRSDLPGLRRSAGFIAPRVGEVANSVAEFLNESTTAGDIGLDTWQRFISQFTHPDRPIRQQLMGLQLLAEIAVVVNREQVALATLRNAAHLGLMDVVWLDQCPLFKRFGNLPEFGRIRRDVSDRAQRVLAAFQATQT